MNWPTVDTIKTYNNERTVPTKPSRHKTEVGEQVGYKNSSVIDYKIIIKLSQKELYK